MKELEMYDVEKVAGGDVPDVVLSTEKTLSSLISTLGSYPLVSDSINILRYNVL